MFCSLLFEWARRQVWHCSQKSWFLDATVLFFSLSKERSTFCFYATEPLSCARSLHLPEIIYWPLHGKYCCQRYETPLAVAEVDPEGPLEHHPSDREILAEPGNDVSSPNSAGSEKVCRTGKPPPDRKVTSPSECACACSRGYISRRVRSGAQTAACSREARTSRKALKHQSSGPKT